MNWSLILFILISVIITAGIDFVKDGKEAIVKNWAWYALSFFTVSVLSYFIKEPIVQKLILMTAVLGFVILFKAFNKIKGYKVPMSIVIMLALFSSCNKIADVDPQPKFASTLTDAIRDTVMVDTTGDLSVLKQVNGKGTWVTVKDTTWQVRKVVALEEVKVMPPKWIVDKATNESFGQPFYYALAAFFFIAAIIILVLVSGKYFTKGVAFGIVMLIAILLAIGGYTANKRVSDISLNNEKTLLRKEYDSIMRVDGNLNKYWQRKWDNNEIVLGDNRK